MNWNTDMAIPKDNLAKAGIGLLIVVALLTFFGGLQLWNAAGKPSPTRSPSPQGSSVETDSLQLPKGKSKDARKSGKAEPQPADPEEKELATMKAKIEKNVPIGTSVADGRQRMERQGFLCEMVKNDQFVGLREPADFLYCDRKDGGGFPSFVVRRWQVALVVREGKVSSVLVTTGLIGP
jgi:hypothetical protein